MGTIFSKMLVRLRKNAGCATAYRFYHDTGGKAGLKMSYRNYLLIEQGRKLPMFEKLGTFIWALRLIGKCAEANAFVSAWLQTMAGAENFKALIEPLLAAKPDRPGLSPMQQAMKKSIASGNYYLTLEQTKVIYANHDNYLCNLAISNDTGAWAKKELAARLKLTEARTEKALRALAGVKLAKEVKKGVYKCPADSMQREHPHLDSLPPELRKKMSDYDRQLEATGQGLFVCQTIIRADESDFRNFLPIMEVDIATSLTYSITEKTERSALFMVEGKITKLRDF